MHKTYRKCLKKCVFVKNWAFCFVFCLPRARVFVKIGYIITNGVILSKRILVGIDCVIGCNTSYLSIARRVPCD